MMIMGIFQQSKPRRVAQVLTRYSLGSISLAAVLRARERGQSRWGFISTDVHHPRPAPPQKIWHAPKISGRRRYAAKWVRVM